MKYPHSAAYTLEVIKAGASTYRPDFLAWMADNFHVWMRFWEEANAVRMAGWSHYSGRTLIEVLRHESNLREASGRWKLNDWYTPDLCRLYMSLDHTAEGFFELRGRSLWANPGISE